MIIAVRTAFDCSWTEPELTARLRACLFGGAPEYFDRWARYRSTIGPDGIDIFIRHHFPMVVRGSLAAGRLDLAVTPHRSLYLGTIVSGAVPLLLSGIVWWTAGPGRGMAEENRRIYALSFGFYLIGIALQWATVWLDARRLARQLPALLLECVPLSL